MPEIITARLRLRMFTLRDVDAYYAAIHSDAEVMRTMPGGVPRPRERTQALVRRMIAWWAGHHYGLWAVEMRSDRNLIGHCGLAQEPDSGAVELAYALARPMWGQGLASEGAWASLRYGFEQAGLDRIIALAVPENAASRRVMEKVGMRFEGITTGFYGGSELALYAAARAEFQPGDAPYRLVEDARSARRPRAIRPA